MGFPQQNNGSLVSNGHVVTLNDENKKVLTPIRGHNPCLVASRWLAVLRDVLKSAVPYLLLLLVYGINGQVHILPSFNDMDCVHLYNVSAFEYSILRFQPHKMISALSHPVLDVLAATPYLLHYTIPVLYPIFLLYHGQLDHVHSFYRLLGVSMWIHYIVWFFIPTAPPWVYDNLALYAQSGTTPPPLHLQHKEGCAFSRLDARTGIPFFFNLFASNPVPFASFPSGHVGWPTCILATAPPGGKLFALYITWVTWATLYSCHHYISDAIVAVFIVMATSRVLTILGERGQSLLRTRLRWLPVSLPSIAYPMNMV